MKIIALEVENFKRLTAVSIKPDGSMVMITGKNRAGKTSILDSIWVGLGGAAGIQSIPIRKGAEQATIKLDLGEIVVTRTFKRRVAKDGEPALKAGDDFTTSIIVEAAKIGEGKAPRFPNPQTMLDSLLGSLTFDPLAFARMDASRQFATLRQFVKDVDFVAIDKANKIDYDARTAHTKRQKEYLAVAAAIKAPEDTPAEPVDESAILDAITTAGEKNADRERDQARRLDTRRNATSAISMADATRTNALKILDERIAELSNAMAQAKANHATTVDDANVSQRTAEQAISELDALPPLAELVDVTELRGKLDQAKTVNNNIRLRDGKKSESEKAEKERLAAEALTTAIDARNADKMAKIAATKMPVPGLTFGDDVVLLDGIPLDQASDAEQLRLSCAIAMQSNPKLRVIRIRDGSLLDEDGLALIAKMAEERDYQVFIERVTNGESIGFVIEEGRLRGQGEDEPNLPLGEAL